MMEKCVVFFLLFFSVVLGCSALTDLISKKTPSVSKSSGNNDYGISICNEPLSCISSFVTSFTNAVQSSMDLLNLFDISQTIPSMFREFIYNYIYASAMNLGIPSPHSVAKNASQPMGDHFDLSAIPSLVRVFANSVGKFLHSECVLNPNNAASLGLEYAKNLAEIVKCNVLDGHVESKMKGLMDGHEKFLSSLGLLVADKGANIASHFGNELKLVGDELLKKGICC